MSDPQMEFANQIDLVHINCGAHFKVIDTDPAKGQVLMQCLACSELMIVMLFRPDPQGAQPPQELEPGEIDTRSDQEIAGESVDQPEQPETSETEIQHEPAQ